ncbi:MAG TPA: hydantoinase B/oxoprolinase family protein [Thermoleophilaceae bacterium]|jgi:N-methylhydantoinase B
MATTEVDVTAALPEARDPDFWDGRQRSYIPRDPLPIPAGLTLHDATASEVDPITHEVVRYALLATNFEHSALLQRLCVSPITMLTRDFQTSLLTELGDLVFLGPNLQYFSNSHSLSIKYILEKRVASLGIAPGDMFLSNDPYVGAPHQPDTALLTPVFVGDELFGWVANTLHYSDVGGSTAGSFCLDAIDTFQEPLSWPPLKLIEAGRLREDVFELFIRQSRLPGAVEMDMRAAIAGNESTRAKLLKLVERYGAETVKAVMRNTMDAAEALFVERLGSIPDGTWSQRGYAESAVPGDDAIYTYQINITKQGDRLIVDNRGTDPQAGSINVTYAAWSGACLAAVTQSMTADLAGAYGGVYRRIEFRPEPGLLNCAEYPAAVSPSGATTTEVQLHLAVCVVAKMLACGDDAARELTLGPCIPHWYCTICGGVDHDGTPWIFPNTNGMMGALGGMPGRDGVDAGGHFWIPEGVANNCEDVEAQFPLLILYRKLLDGGADGAGRHRGGLGFVEGTISWNAGPSQVALAIGDSFAKGAGPFGSNPGSVAPFIAKHGTEVLERLRGGDVPARIHELSGAQRAVEAKVAPFAVEDGDVWEFLYPSAGGFGDPLRRDPERVLGDIEDGLLDPGTAERVYGVVIVDGTVDAEGTERARRAAREERLGHEPGDPVEPPEGARRVGELLHVVEGRWWCNGADLGAVGDNFKDAAVVREVRSREVAPEFDVPEYAHEMADRMVFREFLCPVTGYRIDTEIARADQGSLHDIVLR